MAPKHKKVTRHLKYAWIEFDASRDAAAFCAGMRKLGWRNLIRGSLPRKRDSKGSYYQDSKHPLLPIRWRRNALLILPNDKAPNKLDYLSDPIFNAYRRAHGDARFREEIIKQNDFLARWLFSPGIKKTARTRGELTIGNDFTDYADILAISGHGAGGSVWGGGLKTNLRHVLLRDGCHTSSARLKYLIIATCFNVSELNQELWLLPMRRENPVHGFLGYRTMYSGTSGAQIFRKFITNLKANGGRTPILEAWRKAHAGRHSDMWAALLHVSSKNDAMRDWQAGRLATPDKNGEIRHFREPNYPNGDPVILSPPKYSVHFYMGNTKVTRHNYSDLNVGLFSGEKGALEISKRSGNFSAGDVLTLCFFYYRPQKNEMELTKLLKFQLISDGVLTLKKNLNKINTITTNTDGFEFRVTRNGLSKVKLPFEVHKDAHRHYKKDGDRSYGMFWVKMLFPFALTDRDKEISFTLDPIWLRGPKS